MTDLSRQLAERNREISGMVKILQSFYVLCNTITILTICEGLEEELERLHKEKDQLTLEQAQNLESTRKMSDELKVRD
jgi:hypothetical protein